jgi:hypothetical protein
MFCMLLNYWVAIDSAKHENHDAGHPSSYHYSSQYEKACAENTRSSEFVPCTSFNTLNL